MDGWVGGCLDSIKWSDSVRYVIGHQVHPVSGHTGECCSWSGTAAKGLQLSIFLTNFLNKVIIDSPVEPVTIYMNWIMHFSINVRLHIEAGLNSPFPFKIIMTCYKDKSSIKE